MKQVYIDMDGVVADFDRGMLDLYGHEYDNKIANQFWNIDCRTWQFFANLPPIQEGITMVERISRHVDICFMTSTGGGLNHINIAKQKLDWLLNQGFGEHPVAFCTNTKGKGMFAQPNAVLIDDREKVCEAWRANGGHAHQFSIKSAQDITDLFT